MTRHNFFWYNGWANESFPCNPAQPVIWRSLCCLLDALDRLLRKAARQLSLSCIISSAQSQPKLISARGPASGWIPIIEDHERRSFVSYRSRAARIMAFDIPAIVNTCHQIRCVAQHAIQFHVAMLYTLPLGLSVTFVSPSHLLTAQVAP